VDSVGPALRVLDSVVKVVRVSVVGSRDFVIEGGELNDEGAVFVATEVE
jgi:hypothetical protein